MTDTAQSYDFTHFSGYATPNTTQIPDEFFDMQMAFLTGAEVKTMLYVFRRTLGFKRYADNISLNQLLTGIVRRDGTRLDYGTGLSKSTLLAAIKTLVEKKLIVVEQRQSDERGNEPTTYRLNFSPPLGIKNDLGVSDFRTPLGIKNDLALDRKLDQALVLKIVPTINSITTDSFATDSKKNNNNTDAAPQSAVVVALSDHGIASRVAQDLAAQHDEAFVREKIEFLDFLLTTRPEEIKKPAAWLRKAIEDDFGAPDGFVSAEMRERHAKEENSRKQAVLEAQEQFYEREQAARAAAKLEQEERRQKVRGEYNTAAKDIAIWEGLKGQLELSGEQAIIALLAEAEVLHRENGVLQIGVWHDITIRNLSHPRTQTLLKRCLRFVTKEASDVAFVLLEPTA